MSCDFKSAFEILEKQRERLNAIEEDLKAIPREFSGQAKSMAFQMAMDRLYALRDSLWALDKHFENGGEVKSSSTMWLDGQYPPSPRWNPNE